MTLPGKTAGTDAVLEAGEYAEGAFEARTQRGMPTKEGQAVAEAAAGELSGCNTRLREAQGAHDEKMRQLCKARAGLVVDDQVVDSAIMGLSDGLLNTVANRSRNAPSYTSVFKGSRASAITGLPTQEQPESVDQLVLRLDTIDDFPNKAELRARVVEANGFVKERRELLRSLEAEADLAFSAVLAARQGVRECLSRCYGALLGVYPADRAFIESFFLKRRPAKKAPASAPVEAVPENGAAATSL